MYVNEFDSTVICFNYYRDKAIESIPQIELEYDENSVIKTIKARASRAEHCWFNIYDGQRVVGFIAGTLIPQPWNHEILSANIDFIFLIDKPFFIFFCKRYYSSGFALITGITKHT